MSAIPTGVDLKAIETQAASQLAELLAKRAIEKPSIPIVDGKFVPATFEQRFRLANWLFESGLCPAGFKSPAQVMVALSMGEAVGFDPMASIRAIAVINGKPSIYGDAAVALVQRSGLLERYVVQYTGDGDSRACTVVVQRKGQDAEYFGRFSWADAKRAGLTGKDTYKAYGDRMLFNRARAFAFRDAFADMLNGLGVAEEVEDTTEAEPSQRPSEAAGAIRSTIDLLPDPVAPASPGVPTAPTSPPAPSGGGDLFADEMAAAMQKAGAIPVNLST